MTIGMTYDLRSDYLAEGCTEEETAEFDSERTIEAIEGALTSLGYRPVRIGHIRRLVEALARGERWDMVFNIAEGFSGFAREAQVPALLDAYGIPYVFSDPYTLAVCLHKAAAKTIVRQAGCRTPDFFVVEEEADAARVGLRYPLFAKPLAEGTGKGITSASKILSPDQLEALCSRLLAEYRQPVLVEEFLSGREFTVGIIGSGARAKAIGALEIVLGGNAEPDAYSYVNKEQCETRVIYRLADDGEARAAAELALQAWRALGCRDGGRLDLRSDGNGEPNFIEVNPLAGLHPEHSDLPILCSQRGIDYRDLIGMIMESAVLRLPGSGPNR
ncbi:MAG: D-alanine--D-alanine ligase [Spirochaetales bacterium]|nr:D-alanine--D-alanine ligase [Spirochaetales bacterium]